MRQTVTDLEWDIQAEETRDAWLRVRDGSHTSPLPSIGEMFAFLATDIEKVVCARTWWYVVCWGRPAFHSHELASALWQAVVSVLNDRSTDPQLLPGIVGVEG